MPRFSVPDELAKAVDPAIISTADEVLDEHAADKWHATKRPEVVVSARTTEDVSRTLAFAHKYRVPVTTRGAGTGHCGGCVPIHGGIALSVFGMKQIHEISPSDGVAVAQPGVITGDGVQKIFAFAKANRFSSISTAITVAAPFALSAWTTSRPISPAPTTTAESPARSGTRFTACKAIEIGSAKAACS